jgi:hypothetical protein
VSPGRQRPTGPTVPFRHLALMSQPALELISLKAEDVNSIRPGGHWVSLSDLESQFNLLPPTLSTSQEALGRTS